MSLDYAILVQGAVTCELDDGARKDLKVGDVFVQRGTIHKWINESETEWARMFFVMLSESVQFIFPLLSKELYYLLRLVLSVKSSEDRW